MEEGVPFCPQCNAPQIRVGSSSIGDTPAAGTGGISILQPSGTLQWSAGLPAAGLGGLIAAFLMFIPLGALGLGMIAGGVFAVIFYRRRNPAAANLSSSTGARLGAVSGVFGYGTFTIFSVLGTVIFRTGGQLRASMIEAVEQAAARSSDPQAQQAIEYLKSPPGLALMMIFSMAFLLAVFVVLSSIGGAIGAAMTRKQSRM